MAKKEKTLRELAELEPLPEEQAPDNGQGEQPTTLEDKIAAREYVLDNVDREAIDSILLAPEVQKGGKIRIERRAPLGRDYQYIDTMPSDQWRDTDEMMQYFKAIYGGGDYRCMSSRADGRKYKQFSFTIDYRAKGQLDEDAIARGNREGAKGTNDALVRMAEMLRQPQQSDGFKSSDMLKFMEVNNGKSEQMMTLMMSMMMKSQETQATMMAAIISAVANRSNDRPTMDPIILDLIKTKQEHPPMLEVLEMMRALKELNETNEPEKEETMFDKILKAAQVVIPALQVPGQAAALPPGQPPADGGMVAKLPFVLRAGIGTLIKAAERNSDPGLYADLIMDQVQTEQHKQFLTAILTDPAWAVKLFGDETRIAHIRPWLDELRQQLLTYDTNQPADPERSAGPSDPDTTEQSGA